MAGDEGPLAESADSVRTPGGLQETRTRARMRGHVLLAHTDGRIAIWQTAPEGVRSGAWVVDDDLRPDDARALLTLVERRAVAGLDREDDLAILAVIGEGAGVTIPDSYRATWVDLSEAHLEIAHARAELSRALHERREQAPEGAARASRATRASSRTRQSGGALRVFAPLTYTYPVASGPWPRHLPAALEAAQLALPASPAGPAERVALGKALLLQSATLRWEDTESARLRREPLRDLPSPHARPLPPRWHERVRRAYDIVLAL